ncbi:MarR family winged helix-turn-helix transcriptional regulator [Mycetocola zhadangensis]|uniref:MarR family transcriptional regulator n=1 Tax=Mycetocola zhadangensis TaxID=1164595 RepID=A0A3L7IW13_9MICO|nr:MarR family transcriptional regulator [Mycetocola zhadangensis]RLQ81222.1 MarR family transcriptional regulator [Mycetocola zhadangensis]GGF05076.1 MarR family transcriptional regulator [Mycetocola zhadangensis]
MNDDDEVDLLVDAWADRIPGVDFTPLDVMSRLRRVALRLNDLRADAFRMAELSSWEFDVLAALRRAEPPHEMSPMELSRATMIGTAAMTNRLENLAERGLIVRKANPKDGRSNLARLTPDGTTRVDAAMIALVRLEAEELSLLTNQQCAQLAALLRQLGSGS